VAAVKFEQAMARLEAIVGELEKSDLPLDESLRIFEEGIRLSKNPNIRLKCSCKIRTARNESTPTLQTTQPMNRPPRFPSGGFYFCPCPDEWFF